MCCVYRLYLTYIIIYIKRRDGVVVKASPSHSVDMWFNYQVETYHKTLKNGIHSFLAWRSAHRNSVENKPASLLVMSLGKALNIRITGAVILIVFDF